VKYLAIQPDQIECTSCHARFAKGTSFCGYCGAESVRKTIPLSAVEINPRRNTPLELKALDSEEPGEVFHFSPLDENDFGDFVPKKNTLGVAIISASLFALIGMSFVLFHQASGQETQEKVVLAAIEKVQAPIKAPKVEARKLERFTLQKKGRAFELRVGETSFLEVRQVRDSRYKSKSKRANSIAIRFNHAMEKIEKGDFSIPQFVAIKNASHSEVHFIDKDGQTFRLIDVTKRDARLEKTSAHIRANFLVDQLNSLVGEKKIPIAMR